MTAPKVMDTNPALTIGTVVTAVTALMALAAAFGLPLTDLQQGAVIGAVIGVGGLVQAVLTRAKVWAPASLARVMPVHEGAGPADEDLPEEPGQHKRLD